MHASCSAFSVTEFYDSQLVQEAETLNNSMGLLERHDRLRVKPIYWHKAVTLEEYSRPEWDAKPLSLDSTPLIHFYGTRLHS